MKKIFYLVLLAVGTLFSACTDTLEDVPTSGTLINVVVSGGINNTGTRVSYDPNEDNSVYAVSWRWETRLVY